MPRRATKRTAGPSPATPPQTTNFPPVVWVAAFAMGYVLAACCLFVKPQPKDQFPNDLLTDCYRADRVSRLRILKDLADHDFASDSEVADHLNAEFDAARQRDFEPFLRALAEALVSDKVQLLIEELEDE